MLQGNQYPTFSVIGEYAYSDGELVADLFEEEADATFYQSQRDELVLFAAKNQNGSPAATTIGISKPRQNGKSYAARFYAAYASDFEHKSVLYSAHSSSTVRKMFKALLTIYDNPERYPTFYENVQSICRSKGFEGIYFKDWKDEDGVWHDGGYIEFSTRTNSGARGGTYQVIIIDEAQELTDEQMDALLPTASAATEVSDESQRPQIIMIGTPTPPTSQGTVFKRNHQKAHKNPARGFWWLEWALVSKNIEQEDISEANVLELARQTNPAMGRRIADSTVMNEFISMSKDGFARERLGWWPDTEEIKFYAIDKEKWNECASIDLKPEGKTAYGVKFSADGSEVVLCGAVCPKNGPARISIIRRENTAIGYQWLADWLNQRYKTASCVVIDGKNGVDFLCEKISGVWLAKHSVIKPSAKDVVASATQLVAEINENTLTWYKPQEALNDSAVTSVKRKISGGWGFGGENSIPIEAAALALWGCRTSKRDPSRKMRVG